MFRLDHLVISTVDLDRGAREVEERLGVPLATGGKHPDMGTHNRLLSLGPDLYLEVIAIDPQAPPPNHPRWFDLDHFTGPTRLTNWAVNWPAQYPDVPQLPSGTGDWTPLSRGKYRWRMTIPKDGRLPLDGMAPGALIWDCDPTPAQSLPDHGCRLQELKVSHPQADVLENQFSTDLADQPVEFILSKEIGLSAVLLTPSGQVRL